MELTKLQQEGLEIAVARYHDNEAWTCIAGYAGSGKSTLVHLLPRLYEYDKGSIKIDGIELNSIDKYWIRKNFVG